MIFFTEVRGFSTKFSGSDFWELVEAVREVEGTEEMIIIEISEQLFLVYD